MTTLAHHPVTLVVARQQEDRRKDELGISEADIANIAQLMITFFVRRNLTNTPPTRDLTRMFMALIDDIEQNDKKGQPVSDAIKEKLTSSLSSDAVFEEKLRGAIYADNYDVARFILCRIAESGMTRETSVDLWKRNNNGVYVWTIEHIFPKARTSPMRGQTYGCCGCTRRVAGT